MNSLSKTIGRYTRPLDRYFLPRQPPVCESALDHVGSYSYDFLDDYKVYGFKKCTLWPHYSVAAKHNIISETIYCPNRTEQLYNKLYKYPISDGDGCATTIGDQWSNYYHRYVDIIPKAFALRDPRLSDKKINLYITDYFRKDDIEIVEAMVPDNVEVKQISLRRRIRVDEYIHLPRLSINRNKPCKNHSSLGYLPDAYVEYYRGLVGDLWGIKWHNGGGVKNIYISRRKANKRRIQNEDEVENVLSKYGFETVVLEDMTVKEQAARFSEAKIVVAQHGAGLTNLLYLPKGSSVIEIFSSYRQDPEIYYSEASQKLSFAYHFIMAGSGLYTKSSDFVVDPDRIDNIVKGIA